jgi:mitogen-activated protein kinase 1/3
MSQPVTDNKKLAPPKPGEKGKKVYNVNGQKFEVNAKFDVYKVCGCGSYGTVCAATDTEKNVKVAIKKMARVFDDLVDGKRILRELKVLVLVKHPNLLSLHEFLRPVARETFEDVYVVTDLYDSDLHRIIKSQQKLTDEHHAYFMVQAFRGLHYLHTANIIHRDLKPSNMLVNANCELVLCDFGLARGEDSAEMTEYVVTRWYRPPELLALSSHYDRSVDMWSMGLIFAEVLLGRALLPGKDYLSQLSMVISLLGMPSLEDMKHLSEQARKFIVAQPQREPQNLVGLLSAKTTPEGADLICKMLVFNPEKRISTLEALRHPYFARNREPGDDHEAPVKFTWSHDGDYTEAELREDMWNEIIARSPPNEE